MKKVCISYLCVLVLLSACVSHPTMESQPDDSHKSLDEALADVLERFLTLSWASEYKNIVILNDYILTPNSKIKKILMSELNEHLRDKFNVLGRYSKAADREIAYQLSGRTDDKGSVFIGHENNGDMVLECSFDTDIIPYGLFLRITNIHTSQTFSGWEFVSNNDPALKDILAESRKPYNADILPIRAEIVEKIMEEDYEGAEQAAKEKLPMQELIDRYGDDEGAELPTQEFIDGYMDIHYWLANANFKNGDFDKAVANYTESINNWPEHDQSLVGRAIANIENGDFNGAIEDLNEAEKINPDNDEALYNRGIAHEGNGEHDLAQKDFEEAERIRVEREKTERWIRLIPDPKLWTVGFSPGSSLVTRPYVIGTIHGTIAPWKNSFLEIGLDMGFVSGEEDVKNYYSLYPFAHYALFVPFAIPYKERYKGRTVFYEDDRQVVENDKLFVGEGYVPTGGLYAGIGGGFMMSNYSFPGGEVAKNTPAFDIIAGINILNWLDISYTMRTDFKLWNGKLSVGYTYRFKYREEHEYVR